MAFQSFLLVLLSATSFATAVDSQVNPIEKVVQLLADLEGKIVAEGNAAQVRYNEFSEFCEERAANLGYAIKTAKGEKAELEASISEEAARLGSLDEQIGDLVSDIAKADTDLKAAISMRAKEADDFAGAEKELMETISTLTRAIGILEKHASLVQMKNAEGITQALNVLAQASALSTADSKQLTALVQSSQASDDSDAGAPDGEVYEGHSGNLVDTLQGLLDKATDQLGSLRKAETTHLHQFELVKQALEDEMRVGRKDLAKAKKSTAESEQTKTMAEGNLAQTAKGLTTDIAALEDLHSDCVTNAGNYDAEAKSRAEELKALREAQTVLSETTEGAGKLSYDLNQVSFLQLTRVTSPTFEAVRFVRNFARQQNLLALAQLAVRMNSVLNSNVQNPFGKVKSLITDLIEKLEAAAEADATHKAYCDKELSETKVKQADKNSEIKKLGRKIDGMAARSAQLKAEVSALENALAELARAQAEMDKLRAEEKDAFVTGKADMEQGIEGVRMALRTLNDYYGKDDKAHAAAEGAGSGIIGLLEVIESDFSEGLAGMTVTENAAAAAYDKETKENEVETATKQADVKYKSEEATRLEKAIAEAASDREGVQSELVAVMEYLAGLEKQCIEQAETFAERKRRFEAELAGLKQAQEILAGQAVLLQTGRETKRALRAVRAHSM